jgi:hypothetical protein
MLRILKTALFLLLLACFCAGPVGPRAARAQDAGLSLREAERSVVRIMVLHLGQDDQPIALVGGSGFVVAPGKVVTNYHVVQAPEGTTRSLYYVVPDRFAGTEGKDAQLLQIWPEADLAILNAPEIAAPAIQIAAIPPGKEATVRALGYPGVTDRMRNLPLEKTLQPSDPYVTSGSIALFSDTAPGGNQIETIFHTAPIDHGNSGGPLIDECDRVIGVNTWGAADTLADDGSVESHQGQFASIRSTVLAKFLDNSGVKVTVDYSPCVKQAPVDPAVLAQLEKANASAAEAVAEAKKAEAERDQTIQWVVILIGLAAAAGAAFMFFRSRQAAAKPAEGEAPAAKKPLPMAIWILAGVAVIAAIAWWMLAHPKKETPPPAPQAAVTTLACRLDSGQSFNPPTDAGALTITVDPSTGCINGRTPYEKTATGFGHITLNDSKKTASRMDFTQDLKTFVRRDFVLADADYAAFSAGRKSLGPMTCPLPNDAASAKSTADSLAKMRTLSASYMGGESSRVMTWRCAPQAPGTPANPPPS